MNDQPTPPEDVADVLPLDPALRERVRNALRDVEPQHPDQARAALAAALSSMSTRSRRRPAWLAVAAAGTIGVLSVAGLRGLGTSGPDNDLQLVAAPMASPMTGDDLTALRQAESAEPSQASLDQFRLDILGSAQVALAQCPVQGDERSYGLRPWQGRNVELLVDRSAGFFRVVDATTCSVLLVAPLTP